MASIDKRAENKWRIRVYLGLDPGTGKKKYLTETFHGGYREAQRRSRKIEIEVEERGYTDLSKLTLSNHLYSWLESLRSRSIRPRTIQWYEEIVNNHLVPKLGNIQLKKLNPSHIESYYAKGLKHGRMDGKGGLSAQTVQHHGRVLSQALAHAVRMEVIGRNVAQNVIPPSHKRKEVEPLTPEDIRKLLEVAYSTEFYYPILVAVYTGLRRSEILGLTWRDVNLDEEVLSVNRGLHTHSTPAERLQPPKSDKSKRRVSLPEDLVLALRHYRDTKEADKERLDSVLKGEDPMFARADGTLMHPDSFSKAVVRFANRANLHGVHLHFLRHTQASLLLEQGESPKVISERLGHASSAFTSDYYSHLMPGMEKAAAAKVGVALQGVIRAPE